MRGSVSLGCCVVAVSLVGAACSGGNPVESADSGTIHGFWQVVEIDGERSTLDQSITFTLEPEYPSGNLQDPRPGHRKVSGFGGCNGFGGAYVVTGNQLQSVSLYSNLIGCGSYIELQNQRFLEVVMMSEWSLVDGQMTVTGESGTVVVMDRMEPDGAVGVWTLTEIDGQAIEDSISLTIWPDEGFSGYAGCWISGTYARDGDLWIMNGATSLEAATTTAPSQNNVGAPRTQESVPALFGCESATGSEQRFLALAGSGRIEIDGDRLTITSPDATTASFERG